MADPQAAVLTQLRNIQTRAGKTLAELHAAVAASGLSKFGEQRAWLMATLAMSYGDANAVVKTIGKAPPALDGHQDPQPGQAAAQSADPLDSIYAGNKAGLRPLHGALMTAITRLGPFEIAPKKGYLSLRRKKQFAMVGPATKDSIEIGLNAKTLPADARLKVLPPGGMCQATARIGGAEEIDAALLAWVKTAYEAAA